MKRNKTEEDNEIEGAAFICFMFTVAVAGIITLIMF